MFRITECLSVGPFASFRRGEELRAAGVTHVLNLSEVPSVVSAGTGAFARVEWVPVPDNSRLLHPTAVRALGALHQLASAPGSHVYVHCVAGAIRAPTVLWLYLIALGVPPRDARDWIETRAKGAVAGHPQLVDQGHVLLAQKHGLANFFPHPRTDLIVPFLPFADEE